MPVTQQDLSSAPTPVVNPTRRRAWWPLELYRSALGKKYVMAVTGLIGLAFVFGHMIGNLKAYLGPLDVDHYSEFLRELLVPLLPRTLTLWLARSVLIAALVLHLHAAYSLTRMNHRSRDVGYASHRDYVAANFASRTMRWTGIIVLLFLAWHLADLTWGWANPDWTRGDVYNNVVVSLERIPVAALYVVANLALGFHVFHGAWSLFQSLGINSPRFNHWRRRFAQGFAAIIVLGNLSFPLAVQLGILDYSQKEHDRVVQESEQHSALGTPR